MDGVPGDRDRTLGRVELDRPEPQPAGRVSVGTPETTHYGMNSSLELADREWFRQVVVGPRVEPGDLVPLLAPRRQHDDRRRGIAPDSANHLHPIAVGQATVQA